MRYKGLRNNTVGTSRIGFTTILGLLLMMQGMVIAMVLSH